MSDSIFYPAVLHKIFLLLIRNDYSITFISKFVCQKLKQIAYRPFVHDTVKVDETQALPTSSDTIIFSIPYVQSINNKLNYNSIVISLALF